MSYSREFKTFRILLSKTFGYNVFPSTIGSMRELLVFYKKEFGLLDYIAVKGRPPTEALARMKIHTQRHMP